MTLPAIAVVEHLLEFDDEIRTNMAWSLVAHLFEYKLSTLGEAWLNFNLLDLSFGNARLGIML